MYLGRKERRIKFFQFVGLVNSNLQKMKYLPTQDKEILA